MTQPSDPIPVRTKTPALEVDLFLACGQALHGAVTGEGPSPQSLHMATLAKAHPYMLAQYSGRPAETIKSAFASLGTTPNALSIPGLAKEILLQLQGRLCPLFLESGLRGGDTEGGALFAALAGSRLLDGEQVCYPLRRFFAVIGIPALQWGEAAEYLREVCRRVPSPFRLVEPSGAETVLDLSFDLSPYALGLFGLKTLEKPPRKPATAPQAQKQAAAPEPSVCAIEPAFDLPPKESLVLPEAMLEELEFAAVLCQMGGKAPLPRLLFHGPPGTGKTHTARVLAKYVDRSLAVASIGALLGRWVGDTEKAVEKAFEEAAKSKSLLLLDEVDSFLFDRRNAVQDHQVSKVNSLLHLLDSNPVPVILCTNFLESLDDAVHRRIDHMLAFPVPGPEERELLWEVELEKVDLDPGDFCLEELAEVVLTGGLIRNAVTQAHKRRLVRKKRYTLDQQALLALARAETPKMGSLTTGKRAVGFNAPAPTPDIASKPKGRHPNFRE